MCKLLSLGLGRRSVSHFSSKIYIIASAVGIVLANCGGAQPDEPTGTRPEYQRDGLVFVFNREFSFDTAVDDIRNEKPFVDCLKEAINSRHPQQRLVEFEDFRKAVFPGLSSSAAPRKPEYLSLALERPEIRQRVQSIGIRHIAFVGGVTETLDEGGDIMCGGGYGGAACLGYLDWDNETRLAAKIWDLSGHEYKPSEIRSKAESTGWFAVVGIIPLYAPAASEGAACRQLGGQIAEYLDHTGR